MTIFTKIIHLLPGRKADAQRIAELEKDMRASSDQLRDRTESRRARNTRADMSMQKVLGAGTT